MYVYTQVCMYVYSPSTLSTKGQEAKIICSNEPTYSQNLVSNIIPITKQLILGEMGNGLGRE